MTDNELLIAAGISSESKRNGILEILDKGNYNIYDFLKILNHDNLDKSLEKLNSLL